MPVPFSRTLRALEADRPHRTLAGLLFVVCLMGAWIAWLVAAQITVYEVTETARLEVNQAVHPVDTRVAGRVIATALELDRAVRAGDILVELDSEVERLQLAEARTRLAALSPQFDAVRAELAAEERAVAQAQRAARLALDEAGAQLREVEPPARLAEEEARRVKQLHGAGLIAQVDMLRALGEAERRAAVVDSLRLTVQRLAGDHVTQESDRQVRIERLRREVAGLDGRKAETEAMGARLEYEIEQRRIRAPIAGRLGEVANLRSGAFVSAGATLGTIVPAGTLKVIAQFPPAALGRLHAGQSARVRLRGFPWTQYGSLSATVASVAREVRAGTVRVELLMHADLDSPIPLQHGLPGTVEIAAERVAPAILVLRTVGRMVGSAVVNTRQKEAAARQ